MTQRKATTNRLTRASTPLVIQRSPSFVSFERSPSLCHSWSPRSEESRLRVTSARMSDQTLLRMWRQPHVLEAGWAHRVDHIVVHPRLTDYVRHRVIQKHPWRIGDDNFFRLVVKSVALLHVGDRLGFGQQRLDLRIGIKAVVVGTPLRARQQRAEKIFRIRKISFPSLHVRLHRVRLANRLEKRTPRDRLQRRMDAERREVLLNRL